jgi:phosphoserine phosphatase
VTPFAGVVLDVDSTMTRVEGIEWLATRRGPDISRQVADMTEQAMIGAVALDDVYGKRLALVRPSRDDVSALAAAYGAAVVPGVREALSILKAYGIEITVVSGGIRQAVVPFIDSLGVSEDRVHAVSIEFTADGHYAGFDTRSPLARRDGKPEVVRGLTLARPVLALGDGSTDAELKTHLSRGRSAVDSFAAFVGVAARPSVVAVADYVVHRFDELPAIVLGVMVA